MEPDQYSRIREVFDRAQELSDTERRKYVDEAIPADDSLRPEIDRLLEAARQFRELPDLAPGATISKYRIEEELGAGGFARTYRAVDVELEGKIVVLKRPLPASTADRVWLERHFRDEIRTLASVSHPGIVDVLDSGIDPDYGPFLALQYVEGPTLRELSAPGSLSRQRIGNILMKCAQALAAAHAAGIVHRDVKPENIVIRFAGKAEEAPVLIDFGISSFAPGTSASLTTRIVGSPDYLAPEQAMGHVTRQSDIYSLGCVAVELLTGEKLHRVVRGERPEHAALSLLEKATGPTIAAPIRKKIASMLSFSPADRPQSAQELVDVFDSLCRPTGSKRAQGRLWLSFALLACLALAIFQFAHRDSRPPSSTPPAAIPSRPLTLALEASLIREGRHLDFRAGGAPVRVGDDLHLSAALVPPGFVYLFGESSPLRGGNSALAVLFPVRDPAKGAPVPSEPSRARDRAVLDVQFDNQPGNEQIWIVISRKAVGDLDAVVFESMKNNRAAVTEAAQQQVVRGFLAGHPHSALIAKRGTALLNASTNSDLIIAGIGLEHTR